MARVVPLSCGFVKAFLVRGERDLLVDAGTPGSASRILEGLAKAGADPRRLALVVVTHGHGDHTGALAEIARRSGAAVAVQAGDADYVRRGTSPPPNPRSRLARAMLPAGKKAGEAVTPELVFDEVLDLARYGVDGKVLHTPGHTAGSASVVLESGEAIVGDLVLPLGILAGPPAVAFWAWSHAESLASIRRVLDERPTAIHTAHGGPFRPEALAKLVRRGVSRD